MTLIPPHYPLPPMGRGYKPDPHDADDYSTERLFGAPVETVVPASMMDYRVGYLAQGGAGSCVAHALTRAIDMSIRANVIARLGEAVSSGGMTIQRVHQVDKLSDPPKASRRFLYYNARQQEILEAVVAGLAPPPMRDHGCFPRLAMRAVQKLGYCDEAVFPYTDDIEGINETPPPMAYSGAYDQLGLVYYRIQSVGLGRVAEAARGLTAKKPSIVGLFVDTAFMRNTGALIESIDVTDPDGGGHMLTVLEVTPDEVILDNWWTERYGAGGLVRMSHALFGSAVVSDAYMIETAPRFAEAA